MENSETTGEDKNPTLAAYRALHDALHETSVAVMEVIHACKCAERHIDESTARYVANAARKPICDRLWKLEKQLGEIRSKMEKLP